MMRSYSELSKLKSLKDRYEYLKLDGNVGIPTFDFERWLNQMFYRSEQWKKIRREVLLRDNGNELGLEGYPIMGRVIVHHLNPILISDIANHEEAIVDPEYLVCCSHRMHNAIHYGDESQIPKDPIVRKPDDTIGWRRL